MFFTLGLNKLPFEPQKEQIIYVENEYSKPVNNYIQKNYEAIRSHFKKNGLEFIYMPKLMEKVKSPEFIMYNAPYAEGIKEDVNFTSDFLLQFMAHPVQIHVFLGMIAAHETVEVDFHIVSSGCRQVFQDKLVFHRRDIEHGILCIKPEHVSCSLL